MVGKSSHTASSIAHAHLQSKEQIKALKAQRAAADAKATEEAAKQKAKQVRCAWGAWPIKIKYIVWFKNYSMLNVNGY